MLQHPKQTQTAMHTWKDEGKIAFRLLMLRLKQAVFLVSVADPILTFPILSLWNYFFFMCVRIYVSGISILSFAAEYTRFYGYSFLGSSKIYRYLIFLLGFYSFSISLWFIHHAPVSKKSVISLCWWCWYWFVVPQVISCMQTVNQ